MTFKLEDLKYDYNALEEVIDEETMRIHHGKHHQAYVDNLNKAVDGTEFAEKTLEELLTDLESLPESIRTAVRNNGGGHYNHTLFWETMTPGGSNEPVGELKTALEETFGSFDEFKE
ncbi:MAG: superoxide dismutase, partial [Neofamilia sp.]